jgi:N-acylneuraminate cytidylyltransferase
MIAFIPARMESKRIINKNIKSFYGQSIINYTIQAALECDFFDKVIVSTDDYNKVLNAIDIIDDRIQIVKRSESLSGDSVILYDTLTDYLNNIKYKEKYICLLYPCAPFITSKRLIEGYQQLCNGYDVVFPITKSNVKVQQLLQKVNVKKYVFKKSNIDDKKLYVGKKVIFNKVQMLHPDFNNTNSNDWSDTYIHASQWFWCNTNKLYTNNTLVPQHNAGYIELPWYEAQDIDTIEDWEIAELKYNFFKSKVK